MVLRLEKQLRDKVNRTGNIGTLSGLQSFSLNNSSVITFCVPMNIHPQEPIHQGTLHHQMQFYVVNYFYVRKYSNRPLSHFCKTKKMLLFKRAEVKRLSRRMCCVFSPCSPLRLLKNRCSFRPLAQV